MKRVLALLLLLALCLGLCACKKGDTKGQNHNNESTSIGNSDANDSHSDDDLPPVDAEFLSQVCGKWNLSRAPGWYKLGATLEFREDYTCTFGEEELTWDAAFKRKPWLDQPVEFINIYRNGTFVYEAQLLTAEDGTIVMQISQRDDENIGVPVDYYNRTSSTED